MGNNENPLGKLVRDGTFKFSGWYYNFDEKDKEQVIRAFDTHMAIIKDSSEDSQRDSGKYFVGLLGYRKNSDSYLLDTGKNTWEMSYQNLKEMYIIREYREA